VATGGPGETPAGNSAIPPVYTYWGQFIDHDLTANTDRDESVSILGSDLVPLPPDERPGLRALRGERTLNRQLLLEGADGRRVPVLVQAAPLRDTAGAVANAVVVAQDVTRLREAEQLKDDFLALVSHEFRTPLTAIRGGAHLLAHQGEDLDDETRRELLADVVVESERLDRMLANMLSLTSILAGRLRARTEPVLLAPLARRVAEEVAGRAPDHAFVVDVPADLPPAEADPDLLGQVLRNLYENAVKYAPGGGEVRTTAATPIRPRSHHASRRRIDAAVSPSRSERLRHHAQTGSAR